jgi:Chromosome segregation ATPases
MAYGTEAVSLDDTNMYDSAVDTVERLRRALEQCRDDRKALSEAVDALIEERDQYDADYVQAVGRIEELERELAECRDDRKALSEAVDALIEERDAYDADLAECQQELAQAKENCIALTDAG